jgi:predicted NAD/FAD-binding protein
VPYSFAYNLEHEIAADKIIHTAHHTTPDYTVEAFRYRKEIIATNGENDTFYVGAWMGNALHEGAAQSANDVSALLGGHVL